MAKLGAMEFSSRRPSILVVENFYKDPDKVVEYANSKEFAEDDRYYKGSRSTERHLFPYVKEEFERLLGGAVINDWLMQPYNGCFQITDSRNPLVWHSDSQNYAAAIYLTKDADAMGTSFWKDTKYGYRRPPDTAEHCNEIYSPYNLVNQDNWELVDKVGGVYNRLVIWDGKMIHSASMYSENPRLVQLFFFNVNQ